MHLAAVPLIVQCLELAHMSAYVLLGALLAAMLSIEFNPAERCLCGA